LSKTDTISYLAMDIVPWLSGSHIGRCGLGVGVAKVSIVVSLQGLEERMDGVVVAATRQIQATYTRAAIQTVPVSNLSLKMGKILPFNA
jgi:hypothetical protein